MKLETIDKLIEENQRSLMRLVMTQWLLSLIFIGFLSLFLIHTKVSVGLNSETAKAIFLIWSNGK